MTNASQFSQSTLVKLQEVDADLAAQESQLLSQVESIQEKRRSLQTVIELFAPDTTASILEEAVVSPNAQGEEKPKTATKEAIPFSETALVTEPAESPDSAKPSPQPKDAKKPLSATAKSQKATQFKPATKTAPTPATGWQPYVKKDYRHTSLSEAVARVLESEAEQVWGISAIVKEIFVADIPKEAWGRARDQVTNILAKGVNKNKWYRGEQGSYSISREAVGAIQ